MMKTKILVCGMLISLGAVGTAYAQEVPKVSVNGSARAVFYGDELQQELTAPDTITAPKSNSGHTLADVGVNIRPLPNVEIQGMIRVRNDFGGFWGSGITFDVRQLYVKGVIADIVRYQLGDIDYKFTPYTLYNTEEVATQTMPSAFTQLRDLQHYDLFYTSENTWRQQGAALDFALAFNRFAQELQFHGMASRQQPAAAGANERLFAGYAIHLLQSKYFSAGMHYVQLFDIAGTSGNPVTYHNPVTTFNAAATYSWQNWAFSATGEAGRSSSYYREDALAPELSDYFLDGALQAEHTKSGLSAQVRYLSIGPDFRSAGAQTKRIQFDALPRVYDRITNDQIVRPIAMMDLIRDASLYNTRLSTTLMAYDPKFDNISPYGTATPNRQGVLAGITYTHPKQFISGSTEYQLLSEIRGQGTTELRDFSRWISRATVRIGEWLPNYNRMLNLEVQARADQTARSSEGNVPAVDLTTTVIALGAEIETVPQLDVIGGVQFLYYDGLEFAAEQDTYGQIIYFSEYPVSGNEYMAAAGLRYRFSPNIFVTGMYNRFSIEEPLNATPDYTINSFAFIFKMDF